MCFRAGCGNRRRTSRLPAPDDETVFETERHDVDVARGALFIDRRGLARDHAERAVGVNLVASRAGHLILGMAALQTPDVRRLAQVASQADLVGRGGSQLRWIANIFGRNRLGVFLAGAVARFAGFSLPSAPGIRFHRVMRVPRESVGDILMARPAGFGTRIRRRWRWLTLACGSRSCHHQPAPPQTPGQYCACTELTEKAPPELWQTAQLSPSVVVLRQRV